MYIRDTNKKKTLFYKVLKRNTIGYRICSIINDNINKLLIKIGCNEKNDIGF